MLMLTEMVLFRFLAPTNWTNVTILFFITAAIVVVMLLIAIKVKGWLKEHISKITFLKT